MGWRRPQVAYALGAVALAGLLVGGVVLYRARTARVAPSTEWVQLTDFADSAMQPALSPDGRMLAFLRGPGTFVTAGQVYIKILPNGEPVQLTRDNTVKANPMFSPDGSQLAYTIWRWPDRGGTSTSRRYVQARVIRTRLGPVEDGDTMVGGEQTAPRNSM
jgi:hypothetical protein